MNKQTSRQACWLSGLFILIHVTLVSSLLLRQGIFGDGIYHFASGLEFISGGNVASYNVNPPLHRTLLALPACLLWQVPKLTCPLTKRPEIVLGEELVSHTDFDWQMAGITGSFYLVFCSCIIAWALFRWCCNHYGEQAGICTMAMWTFHPIAISWASCATPDMLTCCVWVGLWIAHYYALQDSSLKYCLLYSFIFGLALLTRYTFLLVPIFSVPVQIVFVLNCNSKTRLNSVILCCIIQCVSLLIGFLMVNCAYGWKDSFLSLDDGHFESNLFCTMKTILSSGDLQMLRAPLPMNYLQGLDLQLQDFDHPPATFFWGRHGNGCWYYYCFILLCKSPVCFVLMICWGGDTAC